MAMHVLDSPMDGVLLGGIVGTFRACLRLRCVFLVGHANVGVASLLRREAAHGPRVISPSLVRAAGGRCFGPRGYGASKVHMVHGRKRGWEGGGDEECDMSLFKSVYGLKS